MWDFCFLYVLNGIQNLKAIWSLDIPDTFLSDTQIPFQDCEK